MIGGLWSKRKIRKGSRDFKPSAWVPEGVSVGGIVSGRFSLAEAAESRKGDAATSTARNPRYRWAILSC